MAEILGAGAGQIPVRTGSATLIATTLFHYLVGIEEEQYPVHSLSEPLQHADKVVAAVRPLLLTAEINKFTIRPHRQVTSNRCFRSAWIRITGGILDPDG